MYSFTLFAASRRMHHYDETARKQRDLLPARNRSIGIVTRSCCRDLTFLIDSGPDVPINSVVAVGLRARRQLRADGLPPAPGRLVHYYLLSQAAHPSGAAMMRASMSVGAPPAVTGAI
jgi:hypothetical protein